MTWKGWEDYVPQVTQAAKPKRSKYNAKPQTVDGVKFASTKEATRYGELKMLEKAGSIRLLALQVPFGLNAGNDRRINIGKYVADFTYEERTGGRWALVVEDVKGMKTPLYRWKKKHVEAQYGISIREV